MFFWAKRFKILASCVPLGFHSMPSHCAATGMGLALSCRQKLRGDKCWCHHLSQMIAKNDMPTVDSSEGYDKT